ncbi:MAG TPA: TolC family protein [Myxococcales bacterium]|nr:TolC family protein [Myxococcales bacterium]
MTLAAAAALVLVAQAQVGPAPRPVELEVLLGRLVELSPELADAALAVRLATAEQLRARAILDLELGGEAAARQSVANVASLGQIFGALEASETLTAKKGFPTGTRVALEQQLVHGAAPNALRAVESAVGLLTPDQYFYDLSSLTLTVTQPLLRGAGEGAAMAAYRAALRGVDAARLRRLAELSRAQVRAAAAYYALYAREQELEIAKGVMERDAQELALTQKRISLGIVPSSDLLRLQEASATHAERAVAARLAAADAQRLLRAELGLAEGGDGISTAVDLAAPSPPTGREAVSSAAVASHPAVLAARKEVERRKEQLTRARDAVRPALDLSAFAGATGFDPGSPAGALFQTARVQRGIYGAGLTFSYPLDGSPGKADVEQAEAELARAEAARQRAEQEAARAAVAMADAVESAAARLELSEKAVGLARQALAAERDRYGQGRGTLFDVLSAEAAASDAERRRAQVQADLLLARFSLKAATGALGLELAGR